MVLKWRNPMRKTVEEHFAEICKRLDELERLGRRRDLRSTHLKN
jgi:hypothetical protein